MEIRSTGFSQTKSLSALNTSSNRSVNQSANFGNSIQKPSFTRTDDDLVISAEALELQSTTMNPAEETAAQRAARIEEIKAQIANGTYDTDEKLNAALDRMFDRILDQEV